MARVFLFLPLSSASMIRGARLTEGAELVQGVGMDQHAAMLGVQVAVGPDGDADEVAQATLQLRRELLDLDVTAVEMPRSGERRGDPRQSTWPRLAPWWSTSPIRSCSPP